MIPRFDDKGNLPPGIHTATWKQVEQRYGYNQQRKKLIKGLREALHNLKEAGCKRIYLNGSFIAEKKNPADYDLCWEPNNVDVTLLDPLFSEVQYLRPPRLEQKDKYLGEVIMTIPNHPLFDHLGYFQQDDRTGDIKGIITIDLSTLP